MAHKLLMEEPRQKKPAPLDPLGMALKELERRGMPIPHTATDDTPAPRSMPLFKDFVEATTPFKLDPWQRDLCDRLQALAGQVGKKVLIHGPPQHGKPCSVDSMVLMGDGSYKRLGDVIIGERVISDQGSAEIVTAVHEQGELACVEITTACGRKTVAALDHPFLTPEGWVEAQHLSVGQSLANVSSAYAYLASKHSEAEFELAGYFVGDGSCGPAGPSCHAMITSNDSEQAKRIVEVAESLGFGVRILPKPKTTALTYALKGGVRKWLRTVGLAGKTSYDKRVPDWVFTGDRARIAKFLGAYFSCDGTVSPKGIGRNGLIRPDAAVEFYSVSRELLAGVQSLLLRFGVQSKLMPKNGKYRGDRHDSWRLTFCSMDNVAQFAAQIPVPGRKGALLRELNPLRKSFQPNYLADTIVSIEPVGEKACRCLTVNRHHTFTVDDIVVHNSVIVSQRYPAWILGVQPTTRIRLACYNSTHAERFTAMARDLMLMPDYKKLFPHTDEVWVSPRSAGGEWSTLARKKLRDTQPSMMALGLQTGFTGQGVDWFIGDDPYASANDAYSETVRQSTWQFWDDTARPRLNDNTNAIWMFHRYVQDDIAGRLEAEGDWEVWRYAAEADAGADCYPKYRKVGEYLSSRYSDGWYEKQKQKPFTWAGQFQGKPVPVGGGAVKTDMFEMIDEIMIPATVKRWVRAWDLAASKGKGAFTAGVLLGGPCADGYFYLKDVRRERYDAADVRKMIKARAELDKLDPQLQGKMYEIVLPQDPGQAGKSQYEQFVTMLAGYNVVKDPQSGDKIQRLMGFASQANNGMVRVVRGAWNGQYIAELSVFPYSTYKDQADATGSGFNHLVKPGGWFTDTQLMEWLRTQRG